MDLQACTDALRVKVGDNSGLGATLKFDCGGEGIVFLDGAALPNVVDNTDRDADCTIVISLENLAALLSGGLDATTGFISGRFTVSGDMAIAMKLQRLV